MMASRRELQPLVAGLPVSELHALTLPRRGVFHAAARRDAWCDKAAATRRLPLSMQLSGLAVPILERRAPRRRAPQPFAGLARPGACTGAMTVRPRGADLPP